MRAEHSHIMGVDCAGGVFSSRLQLEFGGGYIVLGYFGRCLGVDALTEGLPLCTHSISDIGRHLGTYTVLGMYVIGRFQL